jgi:hypothetical protein
MFTLSFALLFCVDLMEGLFERDVALRVSEKFGNKSMKADIDVKKDLAKLELEQFPLRLVGAQKLWIRI